ncbi:MAG: SpoIIE family protein phosphatase [Bacteroidia bacterium]|jgi:serine phosphatase RsbU (regulator of sigma subunit)/HAMP domain-containing protein
MGFRFTIGKRIALGFGVVVILTAFTFLFTNITLNGSRVKITDAIDVVNPSLAKLKELDNLLDRSKLGITYWYFQRTPSPEKERLKTLIKDEFPKLKKEIKALSVKWDEENQENMETISASIDDLFLFYQEHIMARLAGLEDYDDMTNYFVLISDFEDIEKSFDNVKTQLAKLIGKQNTNAITNNKEMLDSFDELEKFVVLLGIILVLSSILIAFFTVRSIVNPIQQLKKMLSLMGKGILPTERMKDRKDEIGEMSVALNDLIDGMERTTDFAKEVGSGNFDSDYRPLSNDDTLGAALLKMREDLRENERVLEAKVIERTEQVVRQKEEIEAKNGELEVLYKHVTDSIKYAKRIQEAILPPDSLVKQLLPDSFVLYKPKDIVSGDFYWIEEKDGKVMFSAVDCTGHGVPGAFMSIVGYNILKQSVINNNLTTPSLILDKLNEGVSETLHHGHEHEDGQAKDGMDISFCSIDYKTLELQYAGAYNPLYIIRNGQLLQTKADKFPIGFFLGEEKKKFTNHTIQLQSGDTVYIFSDGYADQFGGPFGRKFMAIPFRVLLMDINKHPMDKQKEILNKTIEEWRGNLDQVDDILVMGVRIP